MYPLEKFIIASGQGAFGAIRKYDIHTGIDFYCPVGSEVMAIENGVVVAVVDFTGQSAGSPWWNETKAVLVESKSGVICYAEIEPTVKISDVVRPGSIVGTVLQVLKHSKGRPTSMLHLELYKHGTKNPVWWHGEPKPEELLDPNILFRRELCQKNTSKTVLLRYYILRNMVRDGIRGILNTLNVFFAQRLLNWLKRKWL